MGSTIRLDTWQVDEYFSARAPKSDISTYWIGWQFSAFELASLKVVDDRFGEKRFHYDGKRVAVRFWNVFKIYLRLCLGFMEFSRHWIFMYSNYCFKYFYLMICQTTFDTILDCSFTHAKKFTANNLKNSQKFTFALWNKYLFPGICCFFFSC